MGILLARFSADDFSCAQ